MTPVTRRALVAGGGVLLAAACWFGITRAGLWSTGPSGADGRPLNLLIVSIDTIRADRLGSYGYRGARTPYLDALAARGLRFARASTVMPLTLPAHASLLTGTFPAFHGVRDNGGFYLAEEHVTLAESLGRTRLPRGRLRRLVRARLALGARSGVRTLFRQLRSVRSGHRRPGRNPAARRGGGGTGDRVARPRRLEAVLRVGPSLRSSHALRRARVLSIAAPAVAGQRLRRRDCLHGSPDRPLVRSPVRQRRVEPDGDRGGRRSR